MKESKARYDLRMHIQRLMHQGLPHREALAKALAEQKKNLTDRVNPYTVNCGKPQ